MFKYLSTQIPRKSSLRHHQTYVDANFTVIANIYLLKEPSIQSNQEKYIFVLLFYVLVTADFQIFI